MKNKKKGIYVHIPFCERKCAYCDFLSAPSDKEEINAYISSLIREIKESPYAGTEADTIFIGGGTPSFIAAQLIEKILQAINDSFKISKTSEITIEANPHSLSPEKLQIYKKAGINRLSMGLQSVNENELRLLGRIHSKEDFLNAYRSAQDAGFTNINIDIMLAIPGQSKESLKNTLNSVTELSPEHISLYSLIVEDGTPLAQSSELTSMLPDEDTERKMYHEAVEILKKRGYYQYEISNFARKRQAEGAFAENISLPKRSLSEEVSPDSLYASRHNLKYWEGTPYIGFGIGAASFTGDKRFSNTKDISKYIRRGNSNEIIENTEILTENELMAEFMFLGLRKTNGIDEKQFEEKFGKPLSEIYGKILVSHQEDGTIIRTKKGYRLTNMGIDISNYVLADFI